MQTSNDFEEKTVTEIIQELVKYTKGVQIVAALRYGMCPYFGYVLEHPSPDNIEKLLELLNIYARIATIFEDELGEASQKLIDDAEKRQKEIDQGYAKEDDKDG